jgi:hypothetical protein
MQQQQEEGDVYDADPEAQFFMSWMWMSRWLPASDKPWSVLAARLDESSAYVASFCRSWGAAREHGGAGAAD